MENLNIETIKTFIESNKESEEVKGFLDGFKSVEKEELNLDAVKKFLNENKDGQSFYDKAKNDHLSSWRTNNFEKVFNEEAVKRGFTVDETTQKMRELEAKIEASEKKAYIAELKVKAKDLAKEKELPFELVDYVIADSEEDTFKNIETIEAIWKTAVQKEVEMKLGSTAFPPHKTDRNNPDGMTIEQFRKLGYAERVKLKNENPELYNKLSAR